MSNSHWCSLACVVVLALGLAGCTAATGPETLTRPQLEERISLNPDDWEAHRDLGVLLAAEQRFPQAHASLQRAFERRSDDPRTLYYLGVVNEVLGRPPTALRLYERYDGVPTTSEYRDRLEGRYRWLLRHMMREEFREAIAREAEIAPQIGDDALAVLPFNFRGGGRQYEPLGRGFAEMISVDLANVRELTVVERVRLQTLLGELELAASGQVDPATAPRYGRLLRANQLVGGHYGVANDELSVDAGIFLATAADAVPELASASGGIEALFDVQKEVTARILEQLGITPTPEQRERLARVPTRHLTAFTRFSRGLQLEDRQEYRRAAELYEQAAQLDPDFTMAAQKAAECRIIDAQTGAATDLLAASFQRDRNRLIDHRSSMLNLALSQYLIPGVDSRDPVQEAPGAGVLPPLPDPPPPPPSGGGNQ